MGKPAQLQPEKRSRQRRQILFLHTKRLEIRGQIPYTGVRAVFFAPNLLPYTGVRAVFFGVTCAVVRKVSETGSVKLEKRKVRFFGKGKCELTAIVRILAWESVSLEPGPSRARYFPRDMLLLTTTARERAWFEARESVNSSPILVRQ